MGRLGGEGELKLFLLRLFKLADDLLLMLDWVLWSPLLLLAPLVPESIAER